MWASDKWKDYELIDTSDGERLERWGKYILRRPDPQVLWSNARKSRLWDSADAVYTRKGGGGSWTKCDVPPSWNISYGELTFKIKPMGFKHTGLFPEQAANWDWFADLIKGAGRKVKVLNLFAYTGGASVAAAKAGAEVYHVDAAKNMVEQAKENAALSGVSDSVRFFVDDCTRFLNYAKKKGIKYDAIIMDPPSYGRGPSGEVWKLEECVGDFISLAASVLSDKPLFFLVNSYTTGISPSAMAYMLELDLKKKYGGMITADETGLPVTESGAVLPCGGSARWTAGK